MKKTIITALFTLVRHAVHGTSEDKRAELLAKINEADAEWFSPKTSKYSEKQKYFFNFFLNSKLFGNFAAEMKIVSHRRLVEFYSSEGHGDAQAALERWYDIAEKAEWKNLSDIKADFPTTDYVGNQHYVFDIRGNKYRLVVVVKFTIGHIFIRFVGTHSEYDKIDVSTI